jgi:ATP-binding cassette subfamily B protein
MWNRQREATQAEEHLKQVRESDDLGVITRLAPAN